jgi:hypothetical protein
MASKLKWLAGVTLAIGALTHGGMAQAQTGENTCGDGRGSSPLRPPQLLTPSDVKSAAEYAYAQNRRLVFREAADAYQDLATLSDEKLVTPEQRFESALFNAVNLSNQDRSAEAEQRIAALQRLFAPEAPAGSDEEWKSYASLRADPFAEAQLIFFSGLISGQQGDYDKALERLTLLEQRLNSLGLSNTVDAIRYDNGDVEITRVGALRMSRSGGDVRSSRAFGSILGQRTMTAVEKTAILKTHAHYLRSIIHQQLASDATTEAKRTSENALADAEIQRAIDAASVFGVQYAPWLRAKVASRAAVLRLQAGDEGGAKRVAEQALAIYTTYGNGGPLEAELRRTLANIYIKEGNRAAALEQERAAFCVRAAGADLAPIDTTEVLPMLDLLLGGQPSSSDRAVTNEFFRVASAAMEGDTARVVSQSANLMSQRAEAQPEIREAILAEIELAKLKERLAALQNEGRSAGDQDVRIARQQIATTTTRLQEIYSRGVPENLSRQSAAGRAKAAGFLPAQAALADAANADLGSVQTLLQPGELYVRFVLTSEAGYAVAVNNTTARAYRIADAQGLQKRLQVIQEGVLFGLRRDRPERMLDVIDEQIGAYNDLFGPVDDMTQPARRLIIDATGAAANIPFSLLVSRALTAEEEAGLKARVAASGGRDFTGVPWLGRDRSISMVASAVSFKAQREDATGSTAPNPILAFASPPLPNEAERPQFAPQVTALMQQARPRYRRADCTSELEEIYAYPGLEGAYESAEAASKLLAGGGTGYRIISGTEFTDQNLRNAQDLDEYRVLYFGSHGQHPGANKCVQEALLVTTTPSPADASTAVAPGMDTLGDGMLDTSEIQRLALNADLVVLAACETVGMRRIKEGAGISSSEAARLTRLTGLSGGGVIGNFAGSFFVAGARSVLATYWAVENEATNRFMSTFFETAAGGAAKSDSVQAAQRRLMDDPAYSNPIFWAPFVFIGDGSKTLKVGVQPGS